MYAAVPTSGGKAATSTVAQNQREVTVKIDGKKVNFPDQKPVIIDGRTLVPIRGIFEQMGWEVEWRAADNMAVLTSEDGAVQVIIPINKKEFYYRNTNADNTDWQTFTLDVPAQILNSRTILPLRAISEATGYKVDWDGNTYTVLITSPDYKPDKPTTTETPETQTPPKMESGTPVAGVKTSDGLYTNTKTPPLSSFEKNLKDRIEVEPTKKWEYSPNFSNPAIPKFYTVDGYTQVNKYPLYQTGKHLEAVIGDYVGVYYENYLIHLGMESSQLEKIFGEPSSKKNTGQSTRYDFGIDISLGLEKFDDGKWYLTSITTKPEAKLVNKDIYGLNMADFYAGKLTVEKMDAYFKSLAWKNIDNSGFGVHVIRERTIPGLGIDKVEVGEASGGIASGSSSTDFSPERYKDRNNGQRITFTFYDTGYINISLED